MNRIVFALVAVISALVLADAASASILGFGQIGGSNTAVPANYGSNITADGAGYIVGSGATPNIALVWDEQWDVHQSTWFDPLEAHTVGGGDWDNEGGTARVGQLDIGFHTVQFNVDDGFALVLNSFDFAHTAETPGTTKWAVTLADSASNIVWEQDFTFVDGQTETVLPAFTGTNGEDYLLTFEITSETYNSNGRHAIDNLDFTQQEANFILGDVNGDGVVSLLDVAPFVELLTSGGYLAAADINGDGVVSLLDVAPFVNLLTGN